VAITTVGAAAGCSVCLTGRRAEFIAPKRIIPATTAQYCAKYNNAENHKKTSHIASAKNILSIRRRRSYAILICSALKKTVTGQFTGGLRYTSLAVAIRPSVNNRDGMLYVGAAAAQIDSDIPKPGIGRH